MPMPTSKDPGTFCDQDPAKRKARLLKQIRFFPEKTKHPAKVLYVEIDGIQTGLCQKNQKYPLPPDFRSLNLRDENQTARVHILTKQKIKDIPFDNGRLLISIEENEGKPFLIIC